MKSFFDSRQDFAKTKKDMALGSLLEMRELTERISVRSVLGWRPILWFSLLALFLSLETWGLGPYSYPPIHDVADWYLPAMSRIAQGLREHGLTYWYPYHLAGNDERLAFGLFQPNTFFFLYLPIWLATGAIYFTMHLVGGMSMYAFCRARFTMSKSTAAIAAICFTSPMIVMFGASGTSLVDASFSNYTLAYRPPLGFLIPALPAFCLAIDYASERLTILRSGAAGLAIGIVLALSAAGIRNWPYALIVLFLYTAMMGRGSLVHRMIVVMAITATSAIAQIDALNASTYIYPASNRVLWDSLEHQYTGLSWAAIVKSFAGYGSLAGSFAWSLDWQSNLSLFAPYLAVIVSTFLLAAIRPAERHIGGRNLLLIASWFAAFLILLWFNSQIRLLAVEKLPTIFSRLDIGYYTWGIAIKFYICTAFGFALYIIERWPGWSRAKWGNGCRVAILAVLGVVPVLYASLEYKVFSIRGWAQNGSYFANYQSPQLQQLKRLAESGGPFRVATITEYPSVLNIAPDFVAALGFESLDGYVPLLPQRFGQYMLAVDGPEEKQFVDRYGYPANPLMVSSKAYILYNSDDASKTFNLDLLALANVRYVLSPVELKQDPRLTLVLAPDAANTDPRALPMMGRAVISMLRVLRPVLGFEPILPLTNAARYTLNLIEQAVPTNFTGRQIYIYENKLAAPRLFAVEKVEVCKLEDVWGLLSKRSINELMTTAIVESPVSLAPASDTAITVMAPHFTSHGSDSYEIAGAASRAGLLIISNSYSKYWAARVNGSITPTMPAYGAFTAVPIPAGEYHVKMDYKIPNLFARAW